jgi:predicted transposase YdaD
VHNIYLGKQDGEEALTQLRARIEAGEELDEASLIELMLLPLMIVKRPLVVVIEDVARLADRLPKVQRDEVIGTVIGLAYATIKEREATRLLEVLRMAHPIEEFVADLLLRGREEGRTEGRAEGRVEGRVEGREEGQVAERRAMLLETLTLRFESVPTDIVEQLDQVTDLARLRSLTSLATTAISIDDFARSLEQPSG